MSGCPAESSTDHAVHAQGCVSARAAARAAAGEGDGSSGGRPATIAAGPRARYRRLPRMLKTARRRRCRHREHGRDRHDRVATVSAAIATDFAQETAANAHEQWRVVADQPRGKFPKIGALMDSAEHQVLAYMDFPARTGCRSTPPTRWNARTPRSSGAPMSWAASPTTAPSRAWWAPSCSSRTTSGPCSADTCSLRACSPSAILLSLGCLLCSAETRVHLGPSGLWTYTTRWDTILSRDLSGRSGTAWWPARRDSNPRPAA